ncbi:P-loop containing nucleoside triphosphate hydrolase protein [Phlebopus sp. FC_14]|nr:P-loop containing nucleoside triphosphate hydrolase protein [Phlebopus sp. FC_14]
MPVLRKPNRTSPQQANEPGNARTVPKSSGTSTPVVERDRTPVDNDQQDLIRAQSLSQVAANQPASAVQSASTALPSTKPDTGQNPSDLHPVDSSDVDGESRLNDGSSSPVDHKVPSQPATTNQPGSASSSTTTNIILFGETGVGKSSVINLIAGKSVAKVSADVDGCTMASTQYIIHLKSRSVRIFDTVGLEEPQMGVNGYLSAIEKAFDLVTSLTKYGGVHLLLFCMRGGRITATVQSNYRLFHEFLCDKKVPIALVFTGLERERNMDDWWNRNEKNIKKYGIHSVGHACITAVRDSDDPSAEDDKYTESRRKIVGLLEDCTDNGDAFKMESESWLGMVLVRMRMLINKKRNPKQKDTIKILMKRCHMEPEAARRVAALIKHGEDPVTPSRPGT